VTKLDKEHSDIGIALDSAHNVFKRAIVPFTLRSARNTTSERCRCRPHEAYEFDEHGKAKEIDIPRKDVT